MEKKKTKLTDDDLKMMETWAGIGLNIEQMAALLGMKKRTLERQIKKNQHKMGGVEKGRAIALAQVGKTAYQMAVSGKVPAMTMFYLKCRGGWKETQALEVRDETPVQELTKEQKLERLRKIMKTLENE